MPSPRQAAIGGCKYYAHYPAQALFDRNKPTRLLKRSTSPFKGGDAELEKKPIVFWCAPLYEAWSLGPVQRRTAALLESRLRPPRGRAMEGPDSGRHERQVTEITNPAESAERLFSRGRDGTQ